MKVTKSTEAHAQDEIQVYVTLTLSEALRLSYGPLAGYEGLLVGRTAFALCEALHDAIAAPPCFIPTAEIREDR